MSRVLERMKERGTFLGRQIQLSRTAVGDVDGNYTIDLLPVGLDGYCRV
jgi:hypothetical protein